MSRVTAASSSAAKTGAIRGAGPCRFFVVARFVGGLEAWGSCTTVGRGWAVRVRNRRPRTAVPLDAR